MSAVLPLAAAQARLGRPGRPRETPNGDKTVTVQAPEVPDTRMNSGETPRRTPAVQASAPLPRLLTVPMASVYLSLSVDVVTESLEAGTLRRVVVPAPVTAKRRGGVIRRTLLDRLDLDALIATWKATP